MHADSCRLPYNRHDETCQQFNRKRDDGDYQVSGTTTDHRRWIRRCDGGSACAFRQSFFPLEKEQDGVQQRVPYINYETGDQTENKAIIRYRFGDDPDKNIKLGKFGEWKLVYRTPGRITEVPIPFEFKDIPLP